MTVGSYEGLMRAIALPIVILMLTATFAGCVGGDPDGNDNSGIDMEILNEMIDDNLQDFINNTSVTINQEIHYHNNTTYIVDDGTYHDIVNNNFNNTTNVDGGEVENNNYDQSENTWNIGGASFGEGVNGTTSGGGMMFVTHLEFTALDLFPDYNPPTDPQDNDFTYTFTYYDYLTNSERTDTFDFSCSVFYLVGSQSNGSSNQVNYWEDSNNYYNAWEQTYNSTIADLLYEAAWTSTVRSLCEGSMPIPLGRASLGYTYQFLTIDIPEGYAIEYIQYSGQHSFFGCSNRIDYPPTCDEENNFGNHSVSEYWNVSEGPNLEWTYLYGGWENISIDISLKIDTNIGWCYNENGGQTNEYNCQYDYGYYSVWPTSEYEFTLYYRFVPVIPIE